MALHTIKLGGRLQDNVYEDLPVEARTRYTKDEYFGASYTNFPNDNTEVLLIRLNSGHTWRWQRFDSVWECTDDRQA